MKSRNIRNWKITRNMLVYYVQMGLSELDISKELNLKVGLIRKLKNEGWYKESIGRICVGFEGYWWSLM